VTAAAATEVSPSTSVGNARRLRSVPAQAGPAPVRGPGHPLALGRDARARLGGAVHALLDAAGLDGASDAVRLAVLVLASRTPSETGVVEIRTSELGRWLGLSASYTASDVVPVLRRSGVVSVETAEGEYGQDDGLKCRVLPLWAAQDVAGHPLNLSKKEYATLLRLLEAVMAPGWAHRDGRVTPAGLIGTRTGRGAATDRLALLLLVLEARETGRVRLCGGVVDTKRGRAAATVARLLGCTASAGERVLERLEERGLVRRVRVRTASGLAHRTRLMVPAVAAAHGRTDAGDSGEDRAEAPGCVFSDPDVAAGPGEDREPTAEVQVSEAPVTGEAGVAEPDVAAALHTDHPSVVTPVVPLSLSGGFSGEGRGRFGGLPDRVRAREEGPLRGEKPVKSAVEQDERHAAGPGAGSRAQAGGRGNAQQRGRASLPADLRLRVALEPVLGLWERLSGWQQDQVAAATKAELARLAGLLEHKDAAPRLLADRLADRLEETGGEALVDRPFPWLTHRGLVQRPACPDLRCDDGIRLDTGAACGTCGNVIHLKRALRAKLAAQLDQELPGLGGRERRRVLEERLREQAGVEAEAFVLRREQARAEKGRRDAARAAARERAERERLAAEAAQAALGLLPCEDCGLPESAGLCPQCTSRRRTEELARRTEVLVREAVDLAVAVRADLTDPDAVGELLVRCERDTRALLAAACERACGKDADPAVLARTAPQVARRIRDERRESALRRLARSKEAVAEADAVYAAYRRRYRLRTKADAEEAAQEAGLRTAEVLLAEILRRYDRVCERAPGRLPVYAADEATSGADKETSA
jgi:hypothetical protein